ncbi:hypothetical protein OG369_37710 [Streptomyces sp. NBC_01221]|uniref:hypothetical protein n=1 Tax=Streptomyces sp. NBC_01221 TaxID=2903782 RepID=UPI00225B772D|nr:hypothetical protein [Streptomyces sp. NBC_01221]MCX4791625.1 hypothetical protein [Streptomyces sp. NBC_01221]
MTDTTESTGDLFGLTPPPQGNRTAGLAGLLHRRAPEPPPAAAEPPAVPDPFDAVPLRRDQVTGTPAERLAIVEDALRRAKLTEMESVRAARVRGRIEAGAALEILVEDGLHEEAGYSSLDEYAQDVLHIDRTAVYEFIKDSKRLALVAPLSKTAKRPLLPAQAKVLALIVQGQGEAKAREVLERAEGGESHRGLSDGGGERPGHRPLPGGEVSCAAPSLCACGGRITARTYPGTTSPGPRRPRPELNGTPTACRRWTTSGAERAVRGAAGPGEERAPGTSCGEPGAGYEVAWKRPDHCGRAAAWLSRVRASCA